jgi:archaeosortase A (PGF-CTERM-specific)
MDKNLEISDKNIVFFFFLIPTIMLIIGYFVFPFPPSLLAKQLVNIPLFLGIFLLGIGFWLKEKNLGTKIKITGWIVFSFFWATSPSYLYFSEGGDFFNAAVCIIGVYILIYIAYHEWLSIKRNENIPCLNWIAGGTFLAGIIYFTVDAGILPVLKTGLIEIVATQSNWLLNILGVESYRQGVMIVYNETPITIIFACTAIQSIVLFIGMIVTLNKVSLKRKLIALSVTVIPIYFLNLIRNVSVIFLVGGQITSFSMAHNVIAKAGSLIALIILLFITFKLLPELYDEIICIIDLPKRKGPIENFFIKLLRKKDR